MIRFQLRCEPDGHGFDGWFRSGEDYDQQAARGLVSCPACGATAVGKALMSPALASGNNGTAAPPSAAATEQAATIPPSEMAETFAKLQAMSRAVRAKADYVGPNFASEARRIHYGEARERQIYGEASGRDVRALAEEGIAALPLPPLPEDKN